MNDFDFISNEKVINRLGCLLDSGHFPHAIILEGDDGVGKRTLARFLAQALVCRNENKPCGECNQCKKAAARLHPDIYEYSAPGGPGSFHIDKIREIINDVYITPNEAEYKVYILGNAHCMNAAAQNALLKVLEEPPSYVVFILTANNKSAMLQTILSRCVAEMIDGADEVEGAKYICRHNEDINYENAKAALEIFNGNIGKAIDSLADSRSAELAQVCCNICKTLVDDSEYALLCECAAFQKDKNAIIFSCDFLKNIFRDALVYTDGCTLMSGQRETVRYLKSKLTAKKLIDLIDVCDKLKALALMNANNTVLITKICYSLRQAVGR